MKKALALVLALVLALSMAVSAFAADPEFVTLVKVPGTATAKTPIYNSVAPNTTTYTNTAVVNGAGGKFYVALDLDVYDEDTIEVSTTGVVSATLVDYDPDKMCWYTDDSCTTEVIKYHIEIYRAASKTWEDVHTPATGCATPCAECLFYTDLTYSAACKNVDTVNDPLKAERVRLVPNKDIAVVEVTVPANYSARYTEGSYTIKAEALVDIPDDNGKIVAEKGDLCYAKTTVINDVTIFEYEMVKWAAKDAEDNTLVLAGSEKGYSDYETYKKGYDRFNTTYDASYDYSELRNVEDPAVISTTAFRAIAGKDISLGILAEGGETFATIVYIEEVAAKQQGVNFSFSGYKFYNKAGENALTSKTDNTITSIKFGFLGDQVIKSDFAIAHDTGLTWFELRELFEIKVEEDDIISYYLLKDGKLEKEYKIDYMTIDRDKDAVIELELSNTTLGYYELTTEVPATEVAGEENPNTGAESVVGVVAALAVVSLASAAAVSLKK